MVTLGKEPNKALVKKLASLINCDFTHDKKKKKNPNNRKTNSMQKGPQCPRRFLQSSEVAIPHLHTDGLPRFASPAGFSNTCRIQVFTCKRSSPHLWPPLTPRFDHLQVLGNGVCSH